jgi:hypothetical protein
MNFTITKYIGGAAVSVVVFLTGVIGANYSGAFFTHLAEVVNGSNTQTVVALNAPNWASGISMMPPVISSIATSSNPTAASGLASSTPYIFEVAALDGTGTTTLVTPTTITTDASNTQPLPEDINIKWALVNGATGYAIFFGTSTTIGNGLTQYFLATTSGQYTFSTSSGSLAGSYTKNDTTAFSELLNPNGTDIFNDNLNGATSTRAASTTAVQVNGTAVITAPATTTACESDTAGAIFYNGANSHEWGCNGTAWQKIF